MEKIIQISAGRGPAECTWVVAKVLKILVDEAKGKGLAYLVLDREEGSENGTLLSATLQLEGAKVAEFVKGWKGTIKWVGQSAFRQHHKRKNWYIGVYELDLSKSEFTFQDQDVRYEAIRSGGPGGQHVNKVSTAIRATHKPSGISVLASNSRSQSQNKKNAKERLKNILKVQQLKARKDQAKSEWHNHNELERGNPVRTFKGSDFKSNYVDKKYKSERLRSKQKLKDWSEEDE